MPAHLAADIANLYLEFRDLRPAVVHAFLDWSNVRAGMAAALAGVPCIVLSGRNVNPSHFALYQRYMDPVYRVLAQRREIRLVNNSEAGARDYEAWLGLKPGRIGVLRNGVDFGDQARASPARIRERRAALGVAETAPLIGGVFRLFPEKRPMLWVDAAAEIARRNPQARFVIWGQGVLEAELRRHIDSCSLGDRLTLAGVTEDVLSALSALDVFMLTSLKEGTPNVVLEAQWVGTPVVAVEAGGTAEALDPGRTGWIVDPPTPETLADAVCRLLDDPAARASVRDAGPAFVAARFGLRRMVDETLAIYGFDTPGKPR
jgi:glycosyltransferase involved in cell wall biosynthesis